MHFSFQTPPVQNNQPTYPTNSYHQPIFSGPDGQGHCKRPPIDPRYIGIGTHKYAGSFDTTHVTRDAPVNPFPKRSSEYVGGVGWGVHIKGYNSDLLKNGNQIQLKDFRGACQERLERWPFP